jgi:NAD(P)-dependent dehydrogenase (short-subunit alcohol dehydrogenase family)
VSRLLVVGAGPRLGGAIARRFGRDGYGIALISEDESTVRALAEALRAEGLRADYAVADVTDDESLSAAVAGFADNGGVDVVVHNVSVWRDATALDLTADHVLADARAGAASLMTIVHAAVPSMVAAGGGTILATGSAAADTPSKGAPTLGVQKAALRALVQGIAPDLAEQGVHCATITIYGVLGTPGFEPERIAEVYAQVAAEPRDAWRTVVPYRG